MKKLLLILSLAVLATSCDKDPNKITIDKTEYNKLTNSDNFINF